MISNLPYLFSVYNPAIRGLRVNGADDRLSMKTIETSEFQSARKTSKSRLIALLKAISVAISATT
ncbi:MAG: hypothetical protein JXB17_07705 [Bacteroidales bacterium]|nr:hypothetical protein [Bacteroidales bacterium]